MQKKVTKLRKNRPTALIIQYFVKIRKMRILSLWLAVYVCVQTVLASQNATSSSAAAAGVDEVYAMSSLDLSDVMDDFSQMNVLSVVVACLLMVHTHTHTDGPHRPHHPTPAYSHTHTHTHGGWRRGVVVSGVRRMNEVNARRARLVPGWVTVFGRVYHLGM